MAAIEDMLGELATQLNFNGLNYVVSLRLYRRPFSPGVGPAEYIAQALGSTAVIGGSSPATSPEILAEVEEALRHAGAHGYAPCPATLGSGEFQELLQRLLSAIEQAATNAAVTARFSLKEGHPDYPVFWDFGFVIAGPYDALVFIGSSSD